jgi:hypothetical protein
VSASAPGFESGSPAARLATLGIALAKVAAPLAAYMSAERTGAYVHIPRASCLRWMGHFWPPARPAAVAVAEARACALNALAAAPLGPASLRSRSHQGVITLHALEPATGRRRLPSDPVDGEPALHRVELARLSHDGDGWGLLNAAQGQVKALVRQVHHAVAVGAQRAGLRGRAGFPRAARPLMDCSTGCQGCAASADRA